MTSAFFLNNTRVRGGCSTQPDGLRQSGKRSRVAAPTTLFERRRCSNMNRGVPCCRRPCRQMVHRFNDSIERYMMDLNLAGKVAVITGGSVGIGLAVARGLAAEGVHLALCARGPENLAQVVQSIEDEYGVNVLGVPTDVSTSEDLDRFVELIEREFGGADILINNAGTGSEETILQASDERWQHYWDLGCRWPAVRLSRALAPSMRPVVAALSLTTPRSAPHSRLGMSRFTQRLKRRWLCFPSVLLTS